MKSGLFALILLLASAQVSWGNLSVVGGLSREKTARPGEYYEGAIELKNDGESACDVRIYQTDYSFVATGQTFYPESGVSIRSNARWIDVSPQWLAVPGHGKASVHYTVKVPDDSMLVGSYWSIIMIEPTALTTQTVRENQGRGQMGVTTLLRYGIQIVTDVGTGGSKEITFQDSKLVEREDLRVLEIDVENSGDTWMSPFFFIEIYDENGTHIHHFESRRQRIYPGCSVRHSVDLTEVPCGNYKVLAVADNRDEAVFGAQYDLWVK
jgi:hypothetical protein